MDITISVPEATCLRCQTTAPLQADDVRRDRDDTWRVLATARPKGWSQGPAPRNDFSQGLCSQCATAWTALQENFLRKPETLSTAPQEPVVDLQIPAIPMLPMLTPPTPPPTIRHASIVKTPSKIVTNSAPAVRIFAPQPLQVAAPVLRSEPAPIAVGMRPVSVDKIPQPIGPVATLPLTSPPIRPEAPVVQTPQPAAPLPASPVPTPAQPVIAPGNIRRTV